MSSESTYYGYKNREGWAVMLHIDNDEGLYNDFKGIVGRFKKDETYDCEKAIQEWVEELEEMAWDLESSTKELRMMFQEIGSMWRVDWRELAEQALEDYAADEDGDEEE